MNESKASWTRALSAGCGLALSLAVSARGQLAKPAVGGDPVIEHPYPGITCRAESRANPPTRLFITEVDLTNPQVHLRVAPGGPDPDGPGQWQTTLMAPTTIAAREGFDVVVNGDFFQARGVKDAEGTNAAYRADLWGAVVGPAVTDGRVWSVGTNATPCLVVHRDRTVALASVERPGADDFEVVAGNTLLVRDGQVVPHRAKTRHPRTAVGLNAAGTRLTLLVVDGRKPKVAVGMSYDELAAELLRLGCQQALNLDGGGSSLMAVRDPLTRRYHILNQPTDGHERPVANALGITVDPASGAALTPPAPVLAITPDHADGVYAPGQVIHWRIEAATPTAVSELNYTLKRGGYTLAREGKLTLTNRLAFVEATLDEPNTLLLEVKARLTDGQAIRELGGAIVAPERIPVAAPRPADFDAFWAAKLAELAAVPAHPVLTPGDSGKTKVDYWQLTMDNIRGAHIYGQLARPAGAAKRPAMLIVQWAGVYGLPKSNVTDPAAAGWLVLNLNAHDLPIDRPAEFYEAQTKGPLNDYPAIGNDDRDQSYFLRMYLSCYRAAQYLVERPDWDGRTLLVTGVSQGGLQTLMLAGLHPRITAAIAGVPAGCDLTGPKVGRSPGWPAWYWKTQGKDPAKVIEASRYYDVVNFAPRVKCPVLVGVGLVDETCPAAGILAAVNQMQGAKEVVFLPRADHHGRNNTQAAFNARASAWKRALVQGQAPPQ